ncbi:hypothetical protein T492DRAFT_849264 [Pavlovales sp. CCMP2436]|nr:hypothetical protein T492DRAFT_849264 [Pavlovales sp. CCMP2436]
MRTGQLASADISVPLSRQAAREPCVPLLDTAPRAGKKSVERGHLERETASAHAAQCAPFGFAGARLEITKGRVISASLELTVFKCQKTNRWQKWSGGPAVIEVSGKLATPSAVAYVRVDAKGAIIPDSIKGGDAVAKAGAGGGRVSREMQALAAKNRGVGGGVVRLGHVSLPLTLYFPETSFVRRTR